ncbi:LacI family DNA-binding transcriptional regulator [Streptomyces vilmorinianum]|uniref:LacI family DNA-binding transcriptional regulator n=1 Tax=Streptomyces vilmorinianum TaxID=3051092 RepID=UPI0010FADA14|nr:LacI family DNA-binding transcriptional regulator [Streptomyces vilmorinianum]
MTDAPRHGGHPSRTASDPAPRTAPPRVRLVDVAREAGLSKTTVSAALNGTGRLSPAVREKARDTARRMGYRPNAAARQLRAGRARLIGYVVGEFAGRPWTYLESPYFAQLTSATAAAALRHGYALVMLPAGSLQGEWADLPFEAVIVADPVADDGVVEDLLAARIPVFSDASVEGRAGAHWVDVDAGAAVRETLDHLRDQGARRTALVLPDSTTRFHRGVLTAYHAWCAAHGDTPRVTLAADIGNGPVVEAVDGALTAAERPDALFVVAELSPPLVLEAARRHGYDVPGDLLVVCASEETTAAYTDPPVSTLSLRPGEVAEAGIELLVAALENGDDEPSGVLVPTRLMVRGSSRRADRG